MARLARTRPWPFAALLVVSALALLAWGPGPVDRPPNVLLISVDTLRQSSLRAFEPGAQALPHLDRFARSARSFPGARSTASWTLPATASLLTGLEPDRHGATDPRLRIRREATPLAEHLRRAGFETVGFTEGGFLDAHFGFGRGFERYDQRAATARGRSVRAPRGGRPPDELGSRIFDRGAAFLRQRGPEDGPFFLFLQTYAVHEYFRAHERVTRDLPSGTSLRDPAHYEACLVGERHCDASDWEALRALYAAEVRRVDAAFGRLLGILEEQGLREDTWVVLVSDHGEGLEPTRSHHGGRLHEDQLRVPLLVAGPGVVPGATPGAVSLVDAMPTLLELAGLEHPSGLDGVSFAAALRGGPAPTPRPLYAMEHAFWWEDGRRHEPQSARSEPLSLAVMDGTHWYIRDARDEELYDMAADPGQRRDLAAQPTALLEPLRRLAAAREPAPSSVVVAEVDAPLRSQLRSLGYLR